MNELPFSGSQDRDEWTSLWPRRKGQLGRAWVDGGHEPEQLLVGPRGLERGLTGMMWMQIDDPGCHTVDLPLSSGASGVDVTAGL